MSTREDIFSTLEFFPGVELPLTYDARGRLLRAAVNGYIGAPSDFFVAQTETANVIGDLLKAGLEAHLAELFGCSPKGGLKEAMRQRRAAYLGLPADTPMWQVLEEEHKRNRCLTIGELRVEKAKRDGTYVPLVNGPW